MKTIYTDSLVNLARCGCAKLNETFMAGYETQLDAGLGVVCQVARNIELEVGDPDWKVLNFGMGGTGKSLFPEALMKKICDSKVTRTFFKKVRRTEPHIEFEFSLFHIRCLEVIQTYKDAPSLTAFLDRLELRIAQNTPALVFLDELDAFCSERIEQSMHVNRWTMQFIKKDHDGLAIFGIANRPVVVDMAVSRQFKHLFYFPLPDESTVAEILCRHRIPHHIEIARRLCINPVDSGELMNGIQDAIQFLGNGNIKNLERIDVERISDFIDDYLKTPWKKVWDYEHQNQFYINKALKHMEFWKRRKKDLIGP